MNRIIDANANRAREGARVLEDISRLILEDGELSCGWKRLRHSITEEVEGGLEDIAFSRQSESDPGRDMESKDEGVRTDCFHIARANAKRVEEGLRVLEEFSKLDSAMAGRRFKELRFLAYELERQTIECLHGKSPCGQGGAGRKQVQ